LPYEIYANLNGWVKKPEFDNNLKRLGEKGSPEHRKMKRQMDQRPRHIYGSFKEKRSILFDFQGVIFYMSK
jgi:hypothetical protein